MVAALGRHVAAVRIQDLKRNEALVICGRPSDSAGAEVANSQILIKSLRGNRTNILVQAGAAGAARHDPRPGRRGKSRFV